MPHRKKDPHHPKKATHHPTPPKTAHEPPPLDASLADLPTESDLPAIAAEPFRTMNLRLAEHLRSHGFEPIQCYGDPMVYEYHADQTVPILAKVQQWETQA